MKIPNPYFINVPKYGDLHVDQILLKDVYPILFTLKNSDGELFLCLCCEIDSEQRWIVNPITIANLKALLSNKFEVRNAFIYGSKDKVIAVRDYSTEEDTFKLVPADELNLDDLPSKGELLDAEDGEFQDYILSLSEKEVFNEYSKSIRELRSTYNTLLFAYSTGWSIRTPSIISISTDKEDITSRSISLTGRMVLCGQQ